MDLILITDPGQPKDEISTLVQLLDQGLNRLHIRKPDWTIDQVGNLLSQIPKIHYPKISLHQHHQLASRMGLEGIHFKSHQEISTAPGLVFSKSFHHPEDLLSRDNQTLDYAFLSPVFDSISKKGYKQNFNPAGLKKWIQENSNNIPFSLIALGGISPEKTVLLKEMGFDGLAILGAIWKWETKMDRLKAFQGFIKTIQHEA